MFDTASLKNPLVLERYLMSVSPETVFSWFAYTAKKVEGERRTRFNAVFEEKLVLQLLGRGEPLIDLAVATYCDQHEPLVSLWKSGDDTVRAAIVHNTVREGFLGLPTENFVDLFSDDQISPAVLMNPSMPHEALANFFERAGLFERIPADRWLLGVRYALRNPILRKSPETDRFSDDGYDEYAKGRPFTAAWRLLLMLPNDDRTASLLSDAFVDIAEFSPPNEELEKEPNVAGYTRAERWGRFERGTYTFVERALAKWAEPSGKNLELDDEKYGTNRGFIRMGVAAGAARQDYHKNLIALVRDNPDKWTRAGYYRTFRFRHEADVHAAFERDKSFFTAEAVYNKALYQDTPAGRVFRAIVGHQSGTEWEHFSDDQMRRRVFDIWARRLWNEDPTMYPHPDDDLDALHPPAAKRERDETLSDFMYRRAEQVRDRNEARLSQIKTWLKDAPDEPQRVYPLMVRMIESVHRDVQECVTMLVDTQHTQASEKRFKLFR
jgi:hypothetical protein